MNTGFAALQIDTHYIKKLQEMGITEPSPIQADAIPIILEGRDVVGQSQTGSGKTLAYALPVLHKINPELRDVQAIILVPTRELGMQIVDTLDKLTQGTNIRVQQLIGGASIDRQIDKLRLKPQIVVGTPGRVQELLKLRKLKLHAARMVVVDEVDQVFDLGSMQEVESVFRSMLRDKQMLFFSATFPDPIRAVIDRWMREPAHVQVNPAQRTSETLEHLYFVSEERNKVDTLRRLVRLYNPKAAIVFVNDTEDVGEVLAKLQYAGLSIEALYGDSFKQDRAKAMQAFRAGRFQLLLATDVAARGLDLPQVTHVINFDPPIDEDHYVHRVGRTGRMGKQGTAVTIVTPRERFIITKFEKKLGIKIEEKTMYQGKVLEPGQLRSDGRGVKKLAERRVPGEAREAGVTRPERPAAARSGAEKAAVHGRTQPAGGKQAPAAKAAGKSPVAPKAAPPAARKHERERDRKNKGAPRWLKEKQNKQQ
ncbi:DEAD/DEAH box helicase [Paenibacillus silviterrae]|uniref:DEAD/DEAH box helicase n=1 Tax=Paenibacillus silviterrae TaxID=3242194 RepID=UPI002543D7CB|nr:DEAD/DEAH box helicase [Paenibacillus chinjuensis]